MCVMGVFAFWRVIFLLLLLFAYVCLRVCVFPCFALYTVHYTHICATYASDSHSKGICLVWIITHILTVCPAAFSFRETVCNVCSQSVFNPPVVKLHTSMDNFSVCHLSYLFVNMWKDAFTTVLGSRFKKKKEQEKVNNIKPVHCSACFLKLSSSQSWIYFAWKTPQSADIICKISRAHVFLKCSNCMQLLFFLPSSASLHLYQKTDISLDKIFQIQRFKCRWNNAVLAANGCPRGHKYSIWRRLVSP